MNDFLDRLMSLFSRAAEKARRGDLTTGQNPIQPPAAETEVILDDFSLTRLMDHIERTNEGEYICEDTLDLLDEYVELVANHQDPEAMMPLVKGHLEHCVDCTERYEALLKIFKDSNS
jgi:hypothetical protein